MYWRRGSTTSPISCVNIWSASTALSSFRSTLSSLRLLGIHRGLEQLFGVHFAETFEALDLHAAPADLQNLLQDFRDGEKRMRSGFIAFAFDQLEDRLIARGVVIDLQTFARELGDDLLNRGRFVQLDQFAAAPICRSSSS